MIGIVGITLITVVGLVDVLGEIIRDPPPPPVHLLLQRMSSEPYNQDLRVINFKIFVPKKKNAFHKVVNYKKTWNSTGMPKSFKEIFDFYRHEGNYYPNERKITTVPPVTENTLSSVALFPASYHSEVHHDNHYDSFYDGSIVKPVAEVESEGYSDDANHFHTNSTTLPQVEGDIKHDTGEDDNEESDFKKEETYRYYQDLYYHQKSPSSVEFGHVIDSPQRNEVHYEQKDHKNNYFSGKNIWKDNTTGKQGEQFWYSFASNNKT
ncbi:hypothetical protein ACFFRR_010235 [Megaselia abdita]